MDSFSEVVGCLDHLGFSDSEQSQVWSLLAAILHLGNVEWQEGENDSVAMCDSTPLLKSCELLGIPETLLYELLTITLIPDVQTKNKIKKNKTLEEVLVARDALCKSVYERLFLWLVNRINEELKFDRRGVSTGARSTREIL